MSASSKLQSVTLVTLNPASAQLVPCALSSAEFKGWSCHWGNVLIPTFLGWIDVKKTGFIKMVQDVVIAIYMGVSKQVFVYRQFLQLDQWRNIPLWWVGV